MSAVLSTALLCFLFWLLITGQVVSLFKGQASAQVLIAGAIVSIVTALFSARFFVHKKAFYLLNPVKLLSFVFYCLVIFVYHFGTLAGGPDCSPLGQGP